MKTSKYVFVAVSLIVVLLLGMTNWGAIAADTEIPIKITTNELEVDGPGFFDGDSDTVQLKVQGHTTQTNHIFVVETSAGTDLAWITNVGDAEFNGTTPYITMGDAGEEDTGFVFDGNAQDYNISLDDTADDLVIGLGSAAGTTDVVVIDGNQDVGIGGASAGSKLDVTGNALVDGAADEVQLTVQGNATQTSNPFVVEQSDGTDVFWVTNVGDAELNGTTPSLTIGDEAEEDNAIYFDGNAQNYYIAHQDSSDDLILGLGLTPGTTGIVYLDENLDVGLGGASAGSKLDVTGNGLFDGAADEVQLTIQGYTTQTNPILVVEETGGTDLFFVTNAGDGEFNGTTPYLTMGDAGEEDTGFVFDGNAQDYNISLDDTADDLVIGLGIAAGTTDVVVIDGNQDLGIGGASAGAKLNVSGNELVDGVADEVQLTVQGHSTQNASPFVVEQSDGTDLFWITNAGDGEFNGTTPYLTFGDAGEEDTGLVFDGNAQDFNISLDDTADDLVIGLGSAAGTTDIIVLDENQDVGLGGASAGAKLDVTGNVFVDGSADEIQMVVQGNATQTSGLLVLEQSDGTDVLTVSNAGAVVASGDVTVSADSTGGNAGAKNEIVGLPRIKMVATGAGTNGATETTAYVDDSPTGEYAPIDADVTEQEGSVDGVFKYGASSYDATFLATAANGDGFKRAIAGDNLEANESIGLLLYPTATIASGDLQILLTDDGGARNFDIGALTVNKWNWVEVDISSLAAGTGDIVTEFGVTLTAQGQAALGAFDLYLDIAYKWDSTDEEALGVALQQDGVLSIMAAPTVGGALTVLTELTDYFVHYETGNDFVVWITDQSANSNIALVAY